MNAFADWLFTVLLGWTGRVSNNLWSSFSKGGDGFASLLSKIWLPLLLIIIAVSTVIDLIIRLNKRGVYNMRRERLQRLEQEHNTMREAMEHGEMADEYREEIASFVENSPAPFVAEGFFDGQENAPMHHPQQSAPATDFFEPPQEQTFFASENYEYQEPEIYLQPEMQDIYRHEYFDQPTPNSNYIQETYSEQDNYVQEEYTEQDNYNQETYSESDNYNQEIYNEQSNYMQETYPAPTNEEPPRRNRRMDRRKQRYSFFQKTKEADSKESAFNNPVIPENYRYIDRETSFDLDRHYKDEQ